jgi:hypothetical protein
MITTSSLRGALYVISIAASLGLIAMGIVFLLDNATAAKLFGVPLAAGPGAAYVSAAAVRDLSVGALALVFALLRDRRAVGLCALLGAIIPLGDGMIVLRDGPAPAPFLPLHWGSALGCLIFAFLVLRPRR